MPRVASESVLFVNTELARLFVTRGTWNDSNATNAQTKLSYDYVWMRCPASGACTPLSGPSSSSYRTSASDVGDTIYAEVTATNTLGSKQVSSDTVGPVLPVQAPRRDERAEDHRRDRC